ncbi:hypothetical protein A0H81_08072 [Grifola frondosa]|uniref:Uncharacterized protein n=1 Tax=Grifola frondosa TaxID=5627 RepID=A0A1C7M852_GRIFR|nr:hypothetical protein A0H81_08072 [Grifola frondosa]
MSDLPMDVDQSDAMEWTPAQPSEITVDSPSNSKRRPGNSPANENTVDAPRSFNLETPSRGNTPPVMHAPRPLMSFAIETPSRSNTPANIDPMQGIRSFNLETPSRGNTPEPIHGLQPVLTFALETPSRGNTPATIHTTAPVRSFNLETPSPGNTPAHSPVGKQNTWLIESPDIRPDSPVQFNSPAPAGDPPEANVEVPRTQSRAPSTVPLATGDTAGNALPPLQWGQLPLPQAVFPPSVPVVSHLPSLVNTERTGHGATALLQPLMQDMPQQSSTVPTVQRPMTWAIETPYNEPSTLSDADTDPLDIYRWYVHNRGSSSRTGCNVSAFSR